MADLLSLNDARSLRRAVGVSVEDRQIDLVEVWRSPRAGTAEGASRAGLNDWGAPVTSQAPAASTSQRPILVATYPARISRTGRGTEPQFAGQAVSVGDWTVRLNWEDEDGRETDVRDGDVLRVALSHYDEILSLRVRDAWTVSTAYAANALVQPPVSNGCSYLCTQAGVSGTVQPAWPTQPGATVTDGGARWKCDGPLRTLNVVDAGDRPTIAITRIIRCKEVS